MSHRLVCDASSIVALLVDRGLAGEWATDHLRGADLAAPSVLPYEVINVLMRLEQSGQIDAKQAKIASEDFLTLSLEIWPYGLLAARVWELRANLTSYDAAYVAVAELSGRTLVTLDRRLAHAPGLHCLIATPDAGPVEH